jgi:hypothetical protein
MKDRKKRELRETSPPVLGSSPIGGVELGKRRRGYGVDLCLEVKNKDGIAYHIYIEESFCSKFYYYRKSWFMDCRLKSFEGKPHDRYNIWVNLTNRPRNFEGLARFAKKVRVHIFDFNQLLGYLSRVANTSFYAKSNRLTSSASSGLSRLSSVSNSSVNTDRDANSTFRNNDTDFNIRNNVYACGRENSLYEIIRGSVSPGSPVLYLLWKAYGEARLQESREEHGLTTLD